MFKKVTALVFSFLTVAVFLCSCGNKNNYQIQKLTFYSDESIVASYSYTYTAENKPAIITAYFNSDFEENYTDIYGYNDKGEITSYTKKYENGAKESYTAEKITDNKYIIKDEDGNEHTTIIFDETGFIVSNRQAIGYVTEYAYTYDKSGKPKTLKQLDVTPSGSNRVIDFEISFSNKNTCRMTPVGEYADSGMYYEAVYNILN